MDDVSAALQFALGLDHEPADFGVVQMACRAVVVYVVTIIMVRLAQRRFLGRATAFDVILGIMLGSIVSRAVTGNAPLVPTLAAAAVLIVVHWVISWLSYRSHAFGIAVKGRSRVLIKDGDLDRAAMRATHISEHDLRESLRSVGLAGYDEVSEARLERSGLVSVIRAQPASEREPRRPAIHTGMD
jgi:uncharacterized membrane protein YcaP (DUF421 family)